MKAVVMVAHPDDCIIFAYSLMYQYPNIDWTICYLTYEEDDYRGSELRSFWNQRNIKTKFLRYVDDWHDIENKQISFDQARAWIDIQEAIHSYDIVVTHDANGDYGHLHHVFVHSAVADCHPNIITFAGHGQGTDRFTLPPNTYHPEELPQHYSVITGFHRNEHVNEYVIPQHIKELLNNS